MKVLLREFFAGDKDLSHHSVAVRGELPNHLIVRLVVFVPLELGIRWNRLLQKAITDHDIAIGTGAQPYGADAVGVVTRRAQHRRQRKTVASKGSKLLDDISNVGYLE